MKKILCCFLAVLFTFNMFAPVANCTELNKTQLKSDITSNTNSLKTQINKLKQWSVSYGDILIEVIDENKMDSILDYLADEDYIGLATYLNQYIENTTARTDLLKIAYDIDPLLKDARVNLDSVLTYMDEHKNDSFSDNMDFFVSVYNTVNTLKDSLEQLSKVYKETYITEIKAKANRYANLDTTTLNSKVQVMKEAMDSHNTYFKKIKSRYIKFEDLYFEYGLDEMEDDIFSSIESNSNTIAEYVKKFSDKMNSEVIKDVDLIVLNYDLNRYSNVEDYNDDLYLIANNLNSIKSFVQNINRKQAVIGITKLRNCYDNNYSYLLDKLNDAINYTTSKLLNVSGYLESKDTKVVINDLKIKSGFMSLTDMDNKLNAVNGNYVFENSYIVDKKYVVGTNTKVVFTGSNGEISEYVIVVGGDVKGDGLIDTIDLARMAKTVAGLTVNWNYYEASAADVNGDNEVDSIDLARVAKIVAGIK